MGLLRLLWSSTFGKAGNVKTGRGADVLDHSVEDIDGGVRDLGEYRGQVLMLVNVASKCGFTPQYEQLVRLQERYKDQGFSVLGFPANDFMGQEPGSESEIREFCTSKYGVDFPLSSKIAVTGSGIDPLYADLTSKDKNGALGGPIQWNFTKFVVGRDGKVAARIESPVKPDDARVVEILEAELEK